MGKKVFRNFDFCMCLSWANKWNKWKWFVCVFVCVFTQPDYSNSRGHDEQPLDPTMPHASTSAAADEVKHLYLLFYCIAAWNINKFGLRIPHVLLKACQRMMFVNKYKISDERRITITFHVGWHFFLLLNFLIFYRMIACRVRSWYGIFVYPLRNWWF